VRVIRSLAVLGVDVPLEILVIGLITGCTYALLGLGLTLVYKTTRILNFAHGEMGALPALLIPVLVVNHGFSYWLALPLAVATAAVIGVVVEATVIRRLRAAPRLIVLVATIGVAQLLFLINILIPKGNVGGATYPLPFQTSVTIGDIRLGTGQLMILTLVPVIAIGLALFFQRNRIGRASRAVAENVDVARLAGVPIRRVAVAVWLLAGLLAGVSAILIGPTRPVETQAALGPALLVRALGAAMLGGLVNLRAVFIGGVAIGLVEAVVVWNYPVGGVLEMVLFGIILLSLLFQRSLRQQLRGGVEASYSLTVGVRPLEPAVASHVRVRRARRLGLLVVIAGAALLPLPFESSERFFLSSVVLFALMGLSLVVLTGFAGQVSLGQFAIVAVGAVVGGRLNQLGYPQPTAIVYAIAAGAAVAFVIGLPALRLRGLFLAVATLGFAVASSSWMFNQDWLVVAEGGTTSLRIPRPRWFGVDFESELNFYWLCLGVLVVVAAGVHQLRGSGIGRALVAVRDNEPSASAFSLSPRRVKLTGFVISGAIAGLAGYFYGALLVNFANAPATTTFAPDVSLGLVAMVVFGGVTTVTGALVGAFWVQGMPHVFGANIGLLSSGLGLLLVLLMVPGGLAALIFRARDAIVDLLVGDRRAHRQPTIENAVGFTRLVSPSSTRNGDNADGDAAAASEAPLRAEHVTVRYGGNQVLTDVSVQARRGEIVGLMGPNGAGKTTLFDVLTGQVHPVSGHVVLHGVDVSSLPPQERARLGLGRTFQQARLFDDLTVRQTLELALEREEPSEVVPSILGLPPSRRAERVKELRAAELLELLALDAVADVPVSALPTGTRRFLELGSVVAMGADVMLLDEPTAGFAHAEVEAFQPLVRQIRDYLGATLVLVDHHVPMMTALVDRLYVLVAGEVIANGPPSILRDDPRVAEAYLGAGAARSDRRLVGALAHRSSDDLRLEVSP
jgi:ABC-type branched-subunit amino acid transport system ATPase component/ABC-type branched-subunit amino acid transport system permease subunit